jgi:hypothetical protein
MPLSVVGVSLLLLPFVVGVDGDEDERGVFTLPLIVVESVESVFAFESVVPVPLVVEPLDVAASLFDGVEVGGGVARPAGVGGGVVVVVAPVAIVVVAVATREL